jgi:hypothetical protein
MGAEKVSDGEDGPDGQRMRPVKGVSERRKVTDNVSELRKVSDGVSER